MLTLENPVSTTISFYSYEEDHPAYQLDKKYIVANWRDESHLRILLDEIAMEMNYLSGCGIRSIQVKAEGLRFIIDYGDKFKPAPMFDHWSGYVFDRTLCFRTGYQGIGRRREVILEIPRLSWSAPRNHSLQFNPTSPIFPLKILSAIKSKNAKRVRSLFTIQYNQEDPILCSFVQKISNNILYPHIQNPKNPQPLKSPSEIRQTLRIWQLPKTQRTFYKLSKYRKEKEKREKAEARNRKALEKSGTIYKDKIGKRKVDQIYIIRMYDGINDDIYKIGISNAPGKRLQALNTSNPHELSLVHTFVAEPAQEAEAQLHLRFEVNRMSGEWFRLTDKQIAELKQITAYQNGQFVRGDSP